MSYSYFYDYLKQKGSCPNGTNTFSLLPLDNIWTGDLNTFNDIQTENITVDNPYAIIFSDSVKIMDGSNNVITTDGAGETDITSNGGRLNLTSVGDDLNLSSDGDINLNVSSGGGIVSVGADIKINSGNSMTIAAGTTTNLFMDRDVIELTDPFSLTSITANSMTTENGIQSTQLSPFSIAVLDTSISKTTSITASNITSEAFIKTGGTNTQYLMADGSVTTNSGSNAGSNIYLYKNHNTSYAPPITAGDIKYNNAVQDDATIVYISHLTRDTVDIEVFLDNINITSVLYIQDQNNSVNFIYYDVIGMPTVVPNNYVSVPVVLTSSGGTGSTTFGSNQNIILSVLINQTEINNRLTTLEIKTQNQSAVANATTFVGSIIKSGGTSTQFLKADGSVDATTYVNRNANPVSIGLQSLASTNSVSIGNQLISTQSAQGNQSVSVGSNAGWLNQGASSVAVGEGAANSNQATTAVAVGSRAGSSGQGIGSVSIGSRAGFSTQGTYSIAIGNKAGETTQTSQSIILNANSVALNSSTSGLFIDPIRAYSSQTQTGTLLYDIGTKEIYYGSPIEIAPLQTKTQNQSATALNTTFLGRLLLTDASGNSKINIGSSSGTSGQGNNTVAIGLTSGSTNQGASSVAIGNTAGQTNQGTSSVAIGLTAGNSGQGNNAVAIGFQAGQNSQNTFTVAIGANAGNLNQATNSVAIGTSSGNTNQGVYGVAIGYVAGQTSQSHYSVAVGFSAGVSSQAQNSVAIGYRAGATNQGSYSIAIGNDAGQTSQPSQSIILNASSTALNASTTGFFVRPVRAYSTQTQTGALRYDDGSKEIYYGSPIENTIVFNSSSMLALLALTYYFGSIGDTNASPNITTKVQYISPYTGTIPTVNLQCYFNAAGTTDSVLFIIKNYTTGVNSTITSFFNFSTSSLTSYTLASPLVVTKGDILGISFFPSVAQPLLVGMRLQATAIITTV